MYKFSYWWGLKILYVYCISGSVRWTTFNFIWSAQTLNYISCRIVKWIFFLSLCRHYIVLCVAGCMCLFNIDFCAGIIFCTGTRLSHWCRVYFCGSIDPLDHCLWRLNTCVYTAFSMQNWINWIYFWCFLFGNIAMHTYTSDSISNVTIV